MTLAQLLERFRPTRATTAPTPGYDFGLDEFGQRVALARGPHALIGGITGAGKSVTTRAVLMSACRDPYLGLVGLDPKRVELAPFAPRFACVSQNGTEHTALADQLVRLMELRYRILESVGRVEWSTDLNAGPFVLVNLAELSGLMAVTPALSDDAVTDPATALRGMLKGAKADAEVRTLQLRLLGQQARAAGIQLLSDTQRPAADSIDGDFRANHAVRLCLYVKNRWTAEMVLGDIDDADPQPWRELSLRWPGLGYLDDGRGSLRRVRSTFWTPEQAHEAACATAPIAHRLGTVVDWIDQARARLQEVVW